MNGERSRYAGIVAVLLAVCIATAVNVITLAVLYDAIFSQGPGLSENATQILTTAFGGIIGVLGAYLGYRAGHDAANTAHASDASSPATDEVSPPD